MGSSGVAWRTLSSLNLSSMSMASVASSALARGLLATSVTDAATTTRSTCTHDNVIVIVSKRPSPGAPVPLVPHRKTEDNRAHSVETVYII